MAGPSRRQALMGLTTSAWIVATHQTPFCNGSVQESELPPPQFDEDAVIQKLRLRTSCALDEMKRFYEQRLGFTVVSEKDDEMTIQTGSSEITFVASEVMEQGEPFYHIAFNIPANKHAASKRWLQDQQIPIQSVRHFAHWNAHAVFFLDPAENLLEFIARHDLDNAASGGFEPATDALCVSEIAFLVDDDESFSQLLRDSLGLPLFRGGMSVGTDHGILLVFHRGRKWHKPAETFPAEVTIAGEKNTMFRSSEYPYKVEMNQAVGAKS